MKSRWILFLMTILVIAGCQQASDEAQVPTLAVLPSLTPSGDIAVSPTAEAVVTEVTATLVPSATIMPATITAAPTDAPFPLPQATSAAVVPTFPPAGAPGTVRLATLTPVPAGANAPVRTTPQVLADLVISEREFQRELNRAVAPIDTIQLAEIDFVPEGLNVTLTALGGQAFVTGEVLIEIQISGTFATFTISNIEVGGLEPSEEFQEVVAVDFFPAVIETLDNLLTARLGPGHDLENIMMADNEMRVFLLIPER